MDIYSYIHKESLFVIFQSLILFIYFFQFGGIPSRSKHMEQNLLMPALTMPQKWVRESSLWWGSMPIVRSCHHLHVFAFIASSLLNRRVVEFYLENRMYLFLCIWCHSHAVADTGVFFLVIAQSFWKQLDSLCIVRKGKKCTLKYR